jgi:hypothetical protein
MPKLEIDYSNTIIYKITCKDSSIKDVYVGHTTNFVQRKHAHKQTCINDKSPNHQCKLYKTIRENGGWYNWKMEIIHFFNCKDHYEARIKEQEYFVSLNATLNSIEPMPKPKFNPFLTSKSIENKIIYKCDRCNITCQNENLLEAHNKTKKHSKNLNKDNITSESKNKDVCEKPQCNFYCETCQYATCNKKDYNKHLFTSKHIKMSKVTNVDVLVVENSPKPIFTCETCSKVYSTKSGLWKHHKNCNNKGETLNDEDPFSDKKIIIELWKSNKELKEIIAEQNKTMIEMVNKIFPNIMNNDYDSKKHKEYHNIILKASGGATPEEDEKNYNKIIRNVAQESVIDKSGEK